MLKASLGFELVFDVSERTSTDVAVLEGLLTKVGITSAGACLCERVVDPSSLGHRMTMGELAIWFPYPLCA